MSDSLPRGFELAGRYRISGELGRGGMGVVYAAHHLTLQREVALKTLHPRLFADPLAVERLRREARAAASIGHSGIVHVFDLGIDQGIAFLAMERLYGEDLRQRIQRVGALPIVQVLALGRELSQALAAAHQRGVLHRDLSPRNVFLASDDLGNECVKVLDFGTAKLTESLYGDMSDSQQGFGTLMYMPPERVAGAAAGPTIDVYAIGALLYEALSGHSPFESCPLPELALKIALDSPVPLLTLRRDCPAALIAIVEQAMDKDPAKRFASAQELARALLQLNLDAGASGEAVPDECTLDTAFAVAPGRRMQTRRRSMFAPTAVLALATLAGAATFATSAPRPASSDVHARRRRSAAPSETRQPERTAPAPSGDPAPADANAVRPLAPALVPAAAPGPGLRMVTLQPGAAIEANGRRLDRAPRRRARNVPELASPVPAPVPVSPPLAPLPPLLPRLDD